MFYERFDLFAKWMELFGVEKFYGYGVLVKKVGSIMDGSLEFDAPEEKEWLWFIVFVGQFSTFSSRWGEVFVVSSWSLSGTRFFVLDEQ